MTSEPHNQRLIRIYSLPRSGHNAFACWMAAGMKEKPVHLSFVRDYADPLKAFSRPHPREHFAPLPARHAVCQRHLQATSREVMMQSMDQILLSPLTPELQKANRDAVGGAARTTEIIFLRDPYNAFASLFWWGMTHDAWYKRDWRFLQNVWREHAEEMAGLTHYLGDPIFVNYNVWHRAESYRKCMADRLGIENNIAAKERVPSHAGGSSWDQRKYDKRASAMQTDTRWRKVKEFGFYRGLVKGPKIASLARKLFPREPEVLLAADEFEGKQ